MRIHYLLVLLFIIPLVSAVEYPLLKDFVTDNANMLSLEEEAQITQLLKEVEKNTTVEIAVLTVESLEGISIEEYSAEVFKKSGIGKKDKDNGLLILIAKNERGYRFEVGYGLEGVIPDAYKVNIGTRIIEPNFKNGDYGKGIFESLQFIKAALEGNDEVVSKFQSQYANYQAANPVMFWFYLIFFFLFIFGALFGKRRGFWFFPLFIPGSRSYSGGSGGFGSSGFGGFGGGSFGGGGFGGSW